MKRIVAILVWLAVHAVALCQIMPVPLDAQIPIMLKVAGFDRNFKHRQPTHAVIGVLLQSNRRASLDASDEFARCFDELPDPKIGSVSVSYRLVDLSETDNIAEVLRRSGASILYITPMESRDVSAVLRAAEEQQMLTMTGNPEYARLGAGVVITARAGRPSIVINLAACKASGTQFDAQLLRIVQVTNE